MKVVAIVQARMGSTRLPGKVLKSINGKPMIEILLSRLSRSTELDQIGVSTSLKTENDKLNSIIISLGYVCVRGSETDVLARYYETAKKVKADIVVRITADCPLIDPQLVDECIKGFKNYDIDYFSNTNPRSFPDGLDVSVMSFKSIKRAYCEAKSLYDREHVTSFIINSENFSKRFLKNKKDLSKIRWTVDNQKDLDTVSNIFKHFSPNIHFSWLDVLKLNQTKKNLFLNNLK
jgi:glutamate-1-semialdehyde 2,1-aminomutase